MNDKAAVLEKYIQAYVEWKVTPSQPKYAKKALRDHARSLAKPILLEMAYEYAQQELIQLLNEEEEG